MDNILNNRDVPMDPVARLPVVKAKRIRAVVEPLVDRFPCCGANDGRQDSPHQKLANAFQGARHGRLTVWVHRNPGLNDKSLWDFHGSL